MVYRFLQALFVSLLCCPLWAMTPQEFYDAAARGDADAIQRYINQQNTERASAMEHALLAGNEQSVQLLSIRGISPFLLGNKQETFLHRAITQNKPLDNIKNIISVYKKFNSYLDTKNASGNTPLHSAVGYNRPDVITALLEIGTNSTIENNVKLDPFECAIALGNIKCVEAFIRHNPSRSAMRLSTDLQSTLLHRGIATGKLETANNIIAHYKHFHPQIYLQHINAQTINGLTALHYAARMPSIITTLLDDGADSTKQSNFKLDPFECALALAHQASIDAFINHSSMHDKTRRDSLQDTTLHRAIANKQSLERIKNIIAFYKKSCPDALNAQNNFGNTALHYALFNRRPDVITALLESGADASIKNHQDLTPLEIAQQSQPDYVQLFVKTTDPYKALGLTRNASDYDILKLAPEATDADIEKAYKKGALKWHPDKNLDNKEEAEEAFKLISRAYEFIKKSREQAQKPQTQAPAQPTQQTRPHTQSYTYTSQKTHTQSSSETPPQAQAQQQARQGAKRTADQVFSSAQESEPKIKKHHTTGSYKDTKTGESIQDLLNSGAQFKIKDGLLPIVKRRINFLNGIENIPNIHEANKIWVQYHNLLRIGTHSLSKLPHTIRTMKFSSNVIGAIESEAFAGTGITELNFDDSANLGTIEPGAFAGTNLTKLSFPIGLHNAELTSEIFRGIPTLQELYISANTSAANIRFSPDALQFLPNLRKISIYFTDHLPEGFFDHNPNLEEIHLENCPIGSIPSNLFAKLPKLKFLALHPRSKPEGVEAFKAQHPMAAHVLVL